MRLHFFGIDGRELGAYQPGLHYDPIFGTYSWVFTTTSRSVYFNGKLIQSDGGGVTNLAVVTDRLGSVRANSTGGTFRYYPYGEEYTATAQEKVKFGTYYRDQDTGLDYADQRFYRSISGTFVTADPYRATADSANNPADPGSWNRYTYVRNDPVNFNDPSGLFGCAVATIPCDSYRDLLGLLMQVGPQRPPVAVPTDPPKPRICNSKILQPNITSVFAKMGADLNIDPTFFMALAIQESGWNLSHVYETNPSSGGKQLNNLFGLTAGGGNNLAFSSVQASADYWEKLWKPYLSDSPQTIQGFVDDLLGTPGHKYNEADPDWETKIVGGTLSTGKKTIGTYQSALNALDKCDIYW